MALLIVLSLTALWLYELLSAQESYRLTGPHPVYQDDGNSSCDTSSVPVALLSVHSLDPQEGAIGATVTMCFSDVYLRTLRVNDLPQTQLYTHGRSGLRLRARFRNLAFTVTVGGGAASLGGFRIPLDRLAAHDDPSFHTYVLPSVALNANGYPQDFPLDKYAVDAALVVSLPSGVMRHDVGSATYVFADEPFITPASSADLSGFNLTVASPLESQGVLRLVAIRTRPMVLFTCLLAAVPLLLILTLAFLLAPAQERPMPAELLLGGAGVLLAVLPIRTLLVPTGVSSLTLLDLTLGWEVGLLTALIIWAATSGNVRRAEGHASEGE